MRPDSRTWLKTLLAVQKMGSPNIKLLAVEMGRPRPGSPALAGIDPTGTGISSI